MADGGRPASEVVFADDAPASQVLHGILTNAARAFPGAFEDVALEASADRFRREYAEVVPRFEAARVASANGTEIAALMAETARAAFAWRTDASVLPLSEHVAGSASPFGLVTKDLGGSGRLQPKVGYAEDALVGTDLLRYAEDLVSDGFASTRVADGISWIVDRAGTDGLELRGRRVALLGAGAELAPTRTLLEGGADVLWIDIAAPPDELFHSEDLSGSLSWAPDGTDLLAQPARVRATIEAFGADGTVDLGLYGYAPGGAREWRLTAVMNAIVDSLPPDMVRTITMLVSPTTCGVLTPAEQHGERHRRENRPAWQTVLARAGAFGRGPGHAEVEGVSTNRGLVPLQGSSYAAAQYIGKLIAAQAWATGDARHRVSANTAGISRTQSMSHPVFDAAFAGAEAFAVRTFDPATTTALNGLLALRDWLDPDAPCNNVAEDATAAQVALALTSTRIHGGVYELPYPLDRALRVAALIGTARDPRRIGPMIRRRGTGP